MALEVANDTDEIVHVALYKRSPLRPAEPAIAWAIASPPPGGRAILSIPNDYRVFVRYSFSPEDPWAPVYQTQALSLRRPSDSLSIQEVSLGRRTWGAIPVRNSPQSGREDLRIDNRFLLGVWCHIQLGGRDILLPRFLPPYEVLIETLDSRFFLAVVSTLTGMGTSLVKEELRRTEVELVDGKGGILTVYTTATSGNQIALGAPARAERVRQLKGAGATNRTKHKRDPRHTKNAKEQPRTLKPDTKKRKPARKPLKRPTKRSGEKPARRRHGKGRAKKAPPRFLSPSSAEP